MTAGKYFHPGAWNLMAFWYIVGKNMMEMIVNKSPLKIVFIYIVNSTVILIQFKVIRQGI